MTFVKELEQKIDELKGLVGNYDNSVVAKIISQHVDIEGTIEQNLVSVKRESEKFKKEFDSFPESVDSPLEHFNNATSEGVLLEILAEVHFEATT